MKRIQAIFLGCIALSALLITAAAPVSAAPVVRFGAVLNTTEFPDGAYQGRTCDNVLTGHNPGDPYACTWIEDQAMNFNGNGFVGARAPKDGHINKIRLIAGHSGAFKLFLARYKPATQEGKVVRAGPTISYATDACNPNCHIQSFNIAPLLVHKGDVLAIRTNKTSIIQCNSGSDHTSFYKPPLAVGGPFTAADDTDGCYMMLQAQYQ
jgi:hypothetical protein